MPWKERSVMEERMRFVLRLKDGESMASLCCEFGISRVTGYKIYDRYKECGLGGLTLNYVVPDARKRERNTSCSSRLVQKHLTPSAPHALTVELVATKICRY